LAYRFHPVGIPTFYNLQFSCRMLDQEQARIALIKTAERLPATIQSVSSEVNYEQVKITAQVMTVGRNDGCIDRLTRIISRRGGISEVSWKFVSQSSDEEGIRKAS
jgi:hypothetical protein